MASAVFLKASMMAGEYGYDLFYFRRMPRQAQPMCSRPTRPAAWA